jgi:hypothetical protein
MPGDDVAARRQHLDRALYGRDPFDGPVIDRRRPPRRRAPARRLVAGVGIVDDDRLRRRRLRPRRGIPAALADGRDLAVLRQQAHLPDGAWKLHDPRGEHRLIDILDTERQRCGRWPMPSHGRIRIGNFS